MTELTAVEEFILERGVTVLSNTDNNLHKSRFKPARRNDKESKAFLAKKIKEKEDRRRLVGQKGSLFRAMQNELLAGRLIDKDYFASKSTLRVYLAVLKKNGWVIERLSIAHDVYWYRMVVGGELVTLKD